MASSSSSSSSSSAPEKSQPLHNFQLPSQLRWNKSGKSDAGSHKRARSMKSPPPRQNAVTPPPPPPPRFQPPLRDFAAAPPRSQHPLREFAVGPSRFQSLLRECTAETKQPAIDDEMVKLSMIREETLRNHRGRDWSSESEDLRNGVIAYTRNPLKKSKTAGEADHDLFRRINNPLKKSSTLLMSSSPAEMIDKKSSKSPMKKSNSSNLLMKIGKEEGEKIGEKAAAKSESEEEEEDLEEDEIKVWNLRPRNVVKTTKAAEILGGAGAGAGAGNNGSGGTLTSTSPAKKKTQPQKKKHKELSIAISLTKREIEEDIFSLTGAKPSRRPKKRPKNVQKQLDTLFPGLWLLSITPESYKVSESSLK
ncbi:hypothetical protein C2S52_010958, partial [Perilla frutescens var. hirtella]